MNKKTIFIVAAIVSLLLVGIVMSVGESKASSIDVPSVEESIIPFDECLIEVKGEVLRPGIYIVDESYCINDCIILAGGFTKNADSSSLKLASKVSDGLTIIIPKQTTEKVESINKISINNASLEELTSIPGIGTTIANNIITYRNEHGSFKTLEDICNVQRVSENLYNKIKEYICI